MGNSKSKSGSGEDLAKTTLFERGENGTTYRIPALIYLRHCRTFLAFAEKRSSSSDNDAKNLVMRRGTMREDGSVQWSSSQDLTSAVLANHRTMNPCPVYEKNTKTLFLFFIAVLGRVTEKRQIWTGRNRTRLCCISSTDDGVTWSSPCDLTESAAGAAARRWATFGVGPGHGVQLESGRLVVPAYAYHIPFRCCCSLPVPFTVSPRALCIYSEDLGRTWHVGQLLRGSSCECEMAEIIDHEGRSHLYCNARHSKYRREALSQDGGACFDKPHAAHELVEQRRGCQGSIVGFPAPEFVTDGDGEGNDGDGGGGGGASLLSPDTQTWLLFMHPTNKSERRDMGVYLNRSPLHSSGWDRPRVVHNGPSGYSDLAYDQDQNRFSCLMECGKDSELEQIAFMSFSLSDVMTTGRKDKKIR